MQINFTIAYFGGLVTFLAPCGAFLLPAFFACAFNSRSTMLSRLAAFLVGIMTALIPLGAAVGQIGSFLLSYSYQITLIVGAVIAILGVFQAFAIPLPHLPGHQKRLDRSATRDRSSILGVFLFGITYGLAGSGCTGPILGAVLSAAAITGSSLQGALLMAFFSLGMFTPVLLLAVTWEAISVKAKGLFRPRPLTIFGRQTTWGGFISGMVFIILGLFLLFTGGSVEHSLVGVGQQLQLDETIAATFANVPNWMLALIFACIIGLFVAGVAFYRLNHPKVPSAPKIADEEEIADA